MRLQACIFGFLLVVLSVDALSSGGQNVCRRTRVQGYTAQERYKTKCGFLNWGRCTRYRRVSRTRTVTDYICCSGWASADNIHCRKAICYTYPAGTCPNGGVCVRPGTCSCRTGFTRPRCSDVNECLSNKGGCHHICINTVGSFYCRCNSGYGLLSDRRSCKPVCYGLTPGVCSNGGTCVKPNVCQCRAGYATPRCADVIECQRANGGCSQICHNVPGSYQCRCRSGYGLLSDKKTCEPLCHGAPIGTCKNGGTCVRPNVCTCPQGFAAPACEDINECNTNNGGCSQLCTNTPGSFRCSCEDGYGQVTGGLCKAICFGGTPGVCPNGGKCLSPNRCSCAPGYSGSPCTDVNECLSGNGGCSHTCTNTEGSFTCSCTSGYLLDSDGQSCKALCQGHPAGTCQNGGTCLEPNVCECGSGFSPPACDDINECSSSNGGCEQQCENIKGSFRCKCSSGYRLADDGKTCNDIDECTESTSGCSNFCVNEPGGFHCNCPLGYELDIDGLRCKDVNECAVDNGGCSQTCTNSEGSYMCSCDSGFVLDGDKRTCRDSSDCGSKQFVWCWPRCTQSGSSCDCPAGHILHSNGVNCVDSCFSKPCQHKGVCSKPTPNDSTYTCDCTNTGYIGAHCETGVISLPENVRVRAGVLSDDIILTAFPEQELILTAETGNGVQVFPNQLFIRNPSRSAAFKILAQRRGKYSIHFRASGADADSFSDVTTFDVLSDDVFSKYQIPLQGLPEGNFFIDLSLSGYSYRFTSTSPWYRVNSNPNVFFTKGVTFSSVGNLSVPLSVTGLEVNANDNLMVGPVSGLRNPNAGSTVSGEVLRRARQAPFELSVKDINDFINKNSILRQIFAFLKPLLPPWLSFFVNTDSSEPFFFAQISTGSVVKKLTYCAGAPVFDDSVYHVFRFTHAIVMTLANQDLYLPQTDSEQYCMILDLNEDYGTTFIMMFPSRAADLLEKVELFKDLKQETGIRILPNGFGLSLFRKLNVRPIGTELDLWNGDERFKYPLSQTATFWLSLDVERVHDPSKSFDFSIASVPLEMYVALPDLRKIVTHVFVDPWEMYLRTGGKPLEVTLYVKILNRRSPIKISSGRFLQHKLQAFASVGGLDPRTYCGAQANPPGVFTTVFVDAKLLRGVPIIQDLLFNVELEADFFYRLDDADVANVPKPIDIIRAVLLQVKQTAVELLSLVRAEIQRYIGTVAPVIFQIMQEFRQNVETLLQIVNQFLSSFDLNALITNVADLVWDIVASVNSLVQQVRELVDVISTTFEESVRNFTEIVETKVSDIKNNTAAMVQTLYDETVGIFKGPKTFGVRGYFSITVLGLSLDIEGEFVRSDAHLRRCGDLTEFYEHMQGEAAWRAFGVIGGFKIGLVKGSSGGKLANKLWSLLSVRLGFGFGLALASDSNNFVVRLHARLNFFGAKASADVFVTNREIAARAEVNIWSIFRARLTIRATVFVHLADWALRITAEFIPGGGGGTVHASLGDAVRNFVNRLADEAVKRINKAQDAVNKAKGKLTSAQKWLEKKKAAVDKANVVFDKAIAGLERAKQKLEAAKGPFKRALAKLNAAQKRVDGLCKIKKCSKICIPGIKFKVCKIFWGIKIPCPVFTKCMIRIPNPLCILRNIACAVVRAVAFVLLEAAKIFIRIPMIALDIAKGVLSVAQIVVDKARLVLEVVKLAFDVAIGLLEIAKGALTLANVALEAVKFAVRAVQYAINFIVKYGLQSIIDIGACGFEIELSTRDLFEFEVFCEVNPFRLGWKTIRFRLNFKNILGSIWNAAKSLVKGFFNGIKRLLGRRKREVDFEVFARLHKAFRYRRQTENETLDESIFENAEDTISNNTVLTNTTRESEIEFWKEQCDRYYPMINFLRLSVEELRNVTQELEYSMQEVSYRASETAEIRDSLANGTVDGSEIDYRIAEEDFNMTSEHVDDALRNANSTVQDDPVIKESKSATEYIFQGNKEVLESFASMEILPLWRERMKNITEELMWTDECSGFYDCVVWSFGDLYQLVDSVDPQLLPGTQENLPPLEELFYSLFENDTKNFMELKNITTEILNSMRLLNADDIFCGTVPKITDGPDNVTVRYGNDVNFTCAAQSVPDPTFYWLKNQEFYAAGESLSLTAVDNDDSGEYVCVAGNHIANVTSDPAIVTVISPPMFLSQLPTRMEVAKGDNVSVLCNVSATPTASITWSLASDEMFKVENATLALPVVEMSSAGAYKCKAVNQYGTITSNEMTLVVQDARPLCPKLSLEFGFISDTAEAARQNESLLQVNVTTFSLDSAFEETILQIANSTTRRLSADVVLSTSTPNVASLSVTAGCGVVPPTCSYVECVQIYRDGLVFLHHVITRVQDVILSDQPLFIKDGEVYYFNPSIVGVPEESRFCPSGHREIKGDLCVNAVSAPRNFRVFQQFRFRVAAIVLVKWDPPVKDAGRGYILEVSNQKHGPPLTVRANYRMFGFVVRAGEGPTSVRVRAVLENGTSSHAEIIIPDF